MGEVNKG
ncbi:Protein of unknown function [Propionibacterium freudenreichii]|nr:Protein of unknown function [Propionibacterium freudenreichii subsp. freudenreichii]CEG85188.1 Protein of unknown function [Propionibacterium freudenreichii]CEG89390.1 Protein of unknown function [Propionibacterium freudenreichii]CEG95431.1 Protein of unknown function [Propionibacterium freudenreichii]CEG97450.1 Protein of unknown function [Propionibacterium freudenreichii]